MTGDFLDCAQVVDLVGDDVYVAVNEADEDEFSVYLSMFDKEEE